MIWEITKDALAVIGAFSVITSVAVAVIGTIAGREMHRAEQSEER